MNKEIPGLHNVSSPKESAENSKTAYIDAWIKENSDYVQALEKLPKESLIKSLIYSLIGNFYDNSHPKPSIEEELIATKKFLNDFFLLGRKLMSNSTEEEKQSALTQWEIEQLALAGSDISQVILIARVSGATNVQIDANPKIKAYKKRDEILKKGRSRGKEAQKDYAAETKKTIEIMNSDLLKHANTARWTSNQRAEFIKKRLIQNNRKQINGKPYKASTIKLFITGKD